MEDKGNEKPSMSLPKQLTFPIEAFEEVLKLQSSKTVGKVLKRIEITDNKEIMKSQIRELIYESFRDLGDLLFSLNFGLQITSFEFKEKEKVRRINNE